MEGFTIRALDPDHPKVDTSLLLSPDAYPALLATAIPLPATTDEPVPLESILPLQYEWRFYVDPARMRSTQVERCSRPCVARRASSRSACRPSTAPIPTG